MHFRAPPPPLRAHHSTHVHPWPLVVPGGYDAEKLQRSLRRATESLNSRGSARSSRDGGGGGGVSDGGSQQGRLRRVVGPAGGRTGEKPMVLASVGVMLELTTVMGLPAVVAVAAVGLVLKKRMRMGTEVRLQKVAARGGRAATLAGTERTRRRPAGPHAWRVLCTCDAA